MTRYDVFNGDADGICALHQWRLAHPAQTELVTGVKRDNALLARVPAQSGDEVCAFDIALPGNLAALQALLARGVRVRYVDHHEPGPRPAHPGLELLVDTAPDVCTSVLVNRLLDGAHRRWAIVGAFGDNLAATARRMADAAGITDKARMVRWRELGECLNYNAYGIDERDLVYPPAELFRALQPYADPDAFIDSGPHLERLREARKADLDRALRVAPLLDGKRACVRALPDERWSRRVIGTLANVLVDRDPKRAHAVAVPVDAQRLQVSLRVPADAPVTADAVCRRFGGGGRRIAAGIDALPPTQLAEFAEALERGMSTGST